VQQLAFLDACVVAEEPHGAAWRRRQVFQDDSGQTWRAVALPCWREVQCLCNLLCFLAAHGHSVTAWRQAALKQASVAATSADFPTKAELAPLVAGLSEPKPTISEILRPRQSFHCCR